MFDFEKEILNTARSSIDKSIMDSLTKYNGPLQKLCERVIVENDDYLYQLVKNDFGDFINSDGFKESLQDSIQSKISRVLVSSMGGEIEKRLNELRKDPATRAKITVALSNLIDSL